MKDSRHRIDLGKRSESVAVSWLCKNGYMVLDRNFRGYRGEVDVIALRSDTVYFVEVRSGMSYGGDIDGVQEIIRQSVNQGKLRRIIRTGYQYVSQNDLGDVDMEVLIIAVTWYNPCRSRVNVIPVY